MANDNHHQPDSRDNSILAQSVDSALQDMHSALGATPGEIFWADREGHSRKSLDVRVNDLALQGGRKEGQAPQHAAPAPGSKPQGLSRPAVPAAGALDVDEIDGDIPF